MRRESLSVDRPNPPSLVKKVILRDGARCADPMGGRKNVPLHAHHIRERAQGGLTELFNEIALCITCHSALHLGLVKLGFTKTEGKERAREAYLRLKAQLGWEPLEKEIFEAAVRRS